MCLFFDNLYDDTTPEYHTNVIRGQEGSLKER